VVDWGGGMSATCTAFPVFTDAANEGRIMFCSTISSLAAACDFEEQLNNVLDVSTILIEDNSIFLVNYCLLLVVLFWIDCGITAALTHCCQTEAFVLIAYCLICCDLQVITAVGEMFTAKTSPDRAAERSELVAVNSYPRLLAMMLAHASSMVGVRPPKLPTKVVGCDALEYYILLRLTFYARQQMCCSGVARICHHQSVRHLSVCLSVHPSHGWIGRKRLNLGSCIFTVQ